MKVSYFALALVAVLAVQMVAETEARRPPPRRVSAVGMSIS